MISLQNHTVKLKATESLIKLFNINCFSAGLRPATRLYYGSK